MALAQGLQATGLAVPKRLYLGVIQEFVLDFDDEQAQARVYDLSAMVNKAYRRIVLTSNALIAGHWGTGANNSTVFGQSRGRLAYELMELGGAPTYYRKEG